VFIAIVFMSYASLGLILETFIRGTNEIFPIYSWSLFSRIPNNVHDFGLRILTVGDVKLNPTLYFQEADQWLPKASSITAYVNIQKLGKAILSEDAARVEDIRRVFEPLYLGGVGSVHYEVVRRSYNPLDRWKHRRFKSVRSLAFFESSEKEE